MSDEQVVVAFSTAMADAVEHAGASTVTVDGRRRMPATGIGYASDLILTADHVVERDDDIIVTLADGTEASAAVVRRDPRSDLALLRLAPVGRAGVTVAEHVQEAARVGQVVLALGRPSSNGADHTSFSPMAAMCRRRWSVAIPRSTWRCSKLQPMGCRRP